MGDDRPGLALVNKYQDRILAEWRAHRERLGKTGEDLAGLLQDIGDDRVSLSIAPRVDLIQAAKASGIDFTTLVDVSRPAHEKPPQLPPGRAMWILVAIAEGLAVMRLTDAVITSKGGVA